MASDVTIGPPTARLADAAATRLSGEFIDLPTGEDRFEELVARLLGIAAQLPAELVERLVRFRADPSAPGALVLSGMPIDENLPPTPTTPVPADFVPAPVGLGSILLVAALLGEPVAYAAEKDGAIVQNVFPTRAQADKPSNESSAIALEFHTELTFSREAPEQSFERASPDFVLLLALRSAPERAATTSIIEARELCARLDPAHVESLRRPAFQLRAPHSFTRSGDGSRPWSNALPLVRGTDADPAVAFDISCGVRALGPDAGAALDDLRDACADPALQHHVALGPGDLLIIDNHKCAHARSAYDARFDGCDRWLLRTYVRHTIRALRSAPGRSFRVLA